jgi:hypothetical protein
MKTLHSAETSRTLTHRQTIISQKTHYMSILAKTRCTQHNRLVMFFSIRKPCSVSPVRDLCYKSEFIGAWELTLSPVDQCRQTWTREWASRGPPSTLPLSTASKPLCLKMQPLLSYLNYSVTIFVFNILSNLFFTVLQSDYAVYSKSLTVSLNKPRRTDVHIYRAIKDRASL